MHNLKDIILLHLKAAKQAGKDGDKVTIDMYRCYAISAYLLFLVGTQFSPIRQRTMWT
jgi:hypothetical protein